MSRRVWAPEGLPGPWDPGLRYGLGVFTSLRLCGGRALRLDAHWRRMCASAAELGLEPPPGACPRQALRGLEHGGRDGLCRLFLTAREAPPARFWASFEELPPTSARWRLALVPAGHDPRRPGAGLKTLSWLEPWLRLRETRAADADEGLLLTADGQLAEGVRSSVFLVSAGRVRTPPLALRIVPGIARSVLLEHEEVEEAPLTVGDLDAADEVFLSNAVRGVVPGAWRHLRPGPVGARLAAWYERRWEEEAAG